VQLRPDKSTLVGSSGVKISDCSGTLFPAARPRANRAHQAPRTGTTKTQSVQSICCVSVSYRSYALVLGGSAVSCVVHRRSPLLVHDSGPSATIWLGPASSEGGTSKAALSTNAGKGSRTRNRLLRRQLITAASSRCLLGHLQHRLLLADLGRPRPWHSPWTTS